MAGKNRKQIGAERQRIRRSRQTDEKLLLGLRPLAGGPDAGLQPPGADPQADLYPDQPGADLILKR